MHLLSDIFLLSFSDDHQLHHPMYEKKNNVYIYTVFLNQFFVY